MASAFDWICRQDARHRLVISALLAALVFFGLAGRVPHSTQLLAAWNTFAACVLALAWLTIITTPATKLRARAKEQDVSRLLIFVFIVGAACTSLLAVVWLLRANKGGASLHLSVHLGLTILAVACAWLLLHTVFGLRYAHTFYGDGECSPEDRHAGGLDFPGERQPNYLDFAYFSFVIGMTFQVSDVQITSRQIRALALLHGILSFVFNSVILALMISAISSLL